MWLNRSRVAIIMKGGKNSRNLDPPTEKLVDDPVRGRDGGMQRCAEMRTITIPGTQVPLG
jgi:hypothetical protein